MIAIDQHCAGLDGTLLFQQIAVVNSFTVSAIAVLARWLKMDAEETRVKESLTLDHPNKLGQVHVAPN